MALTSCHLREIRRVLASNWRYPCSTSIFRPRVIPSIKPDSCSPSAFLHTSLPRKQKTIQQEPSLLRYRLPRKAWDAHMHVVDPRYPITVKAAYQATPHTYDEAIAFESSLGIENILLVQPSVYGFDNSCLLNALQRIGPSHGRGVVVIDPSKVDGKTLATWHSLGIRGVRVNLKSVGKAPSQGELEQILVEHAKVVRPLGWMIQVWMSLDMVPLLEPIVPQLNVKVCLDHFGGPELPLMTRDRGASFNPYSLHGFPALISLLRGGQTYVKISAPYRLSKDQSMHDIESIAREFLREAPRRVLYATDWPHTRYSDINIEPFTELCLRLCEAESGLKERVFRLNAEELLDGK